MTVQKSHFILVYNVIQISSQNAPWRCYHNQGFILWCRAHNTPVGTKTARINHAAIKGQKYRNVVSELHTIHFTFTN